MPISVQTLINILEKLAPKRLAYEWDHVGLQIGSIHGHVKAVYVALDATPAVLQEAQEMGADFIVTHHPLLFKPLTAIRTDLYQGRMIHDALVAGIRIYAAHTNLDLANGGVNDALAQRLQLQNPKILRQDSSDRLEKIVVFVPQGHEDHVHKAMSAAGAGWIGQYSHCSFQSTGTGTFLPQPESSPFIGAQGKLERVAEIRLETIVPAGVRNRVVRAMLKAHPYEEVAYDIYPLLNDGEAYGLGRVGVLDSELPFSEFCDFVKESLQVSCVRGAGAPGRKIKKVAVCGGDGGELIQTAAFAGADVLVTGDVKYHEVQDAVAAGIAIVDAGHDVTERVIVPVLKNYLRQELRTLGSDIDVFASTIETTPWRIY